MENTGKGMMMVDAIIRLIVSRIVAQLGPVVQDVESFLVSVGIRPWNSIKE